MRPKTEDPPEPARRPIPLEEIETPALLLDLDVLEQNLGRMSRRMHQLGVALRPHFKTHKNPQIAELQYYLGVSGFTASTLEEAEALAWRGFDVTWAFPLILNRLPGLSLDRDGYGTIRLLVDSMEAVDALEARFGRDPGYGVHVWIKVDCGYHRAGVDPESQLLIDLARRLRDSGRLTFDGILTHSGQAYDARGRDALRLVAEHERRLMVDCAERLRRRRIKVRGVSIGSTPAMSVVDNLDGITEVRPGNYVFYDATQCELGSCDVGDCALTVLSSVVSSQPGAKHSVIDAGALSLSKDLGPSWVKPRPSYGRIYADYERKELEPGLRVTSVSQEHGIVNGGLKVGARVRILPNHSCLVVPHFPQYLVVRGGAVVDVWPMLPGIYSGF
jgi:D-serine deaminase-like pyridoxal phosphate-dependent protein